MRLPFLALAMSCTLTGCATIFTSSHDAVTINSTPPGATLMLDGNRIGKTPTTIQVKRSLAPARIEVKADGYYNNAVNLQNTFNTASVFNILFWPGFIVDAVTGNMMKASQLTYDVELEPKEKPRS